MAYQSIESVIISTLRGNSTLTAMLSTYSQAPSIFSDLAPEKAATPYLVIGITRVPTDPEVGLFNMYINYFDEGASRENARAALQKIEEILDYKILTGSSWDTIRVFYESGGFVGDSYSRDIHYNQQYTIRAGRRAWLETL